MYSATPDKSALARAVAHRIFVESAPAFRIRYAISLRRPREGARVRAGQQPRRTEGDEGGRYGWLKS